MQLKSLLATFGLAKVGQDNGSSAVFKARLRFRA